MDQQEREQAVGADGQARVQLSLDKERSQEKGDAEYVSIGYPELHRAVGVWGRKNRYTREGMGMGKDQDAGRQGSDADEKQIPVVLDMARIPHNDEHKQGHQRGGQFHKVVEEKKAVPAARVQSAKDQDHRQCGGSVL